MLPKFLRKTVKVGGLLPMEVTNPKLSWRIRLAALAAAVAAAATAASQFLGG